MTERIPARAELPHHDDPSAPGAAGAGWRRLCIPVLLLLLAGGLAACSSSAAASLPGPDCASGAPKITVAAGGQASATPDLLTINIGVDVTDVTASAALSEANQKASSLTSTLTSSGVASRDIKSTNLSILPTTAPDGTITGYQVTNDLVVTLHDLADAGRTIDAAAAAAGNAIRIDGLTFSVSDTRNVDGQARSKAVATAAAHAQAMTRAAGQSVEGVCSINDSTANPTPVLQDATRFAPGDVAASVPLQPGTQQATAQVTVVYAIANS